MSKYFATLGVASLLALSVGDAEARRHYSPGCNTRTCTKRVCTSKACKGRIAARLRAKAAQSISSADRAWLAKVRACESGGNYATNTGNGFYGAYQFTKGSWGAVGGSGLPSEASPGEQDRRALMLRNRSGTGNWPVCG